jgi:hypothetical protein
MLKIQGNQDPNHLSITNKTHHSKCKNLDQQSKEWMSPTVSHATAAIINFPMPLGRGISSINVLCSKHYQFEN